MADEPRRSVRATKGQHTKNDVLEQPAEPKKKNTKKSKKAAEPEEEEVEVIRCVCGATETADDDEEPWIACDKCGVWQHNVCVGVSTFTEDIPDNYLCEQCDPVFHKDLLTALKHGQKLWVDRRHAFEQSKADEANSKKKGKKGKGARQSDQHKLETPSKAPNGKAKSPSVPIESKKDKKEPAPKAGSAKKNTRDESHDKELVKEPQAKKQRVSHPSPPRESPPSDFPAHITDLEPGRKACATLISKSLAHSVSVAVKDGRYTTSANDTVATKVERLSIQVENAIHETHPDKAAYNKQARAVAANLKSNQELSNGLLARTLSPQALAVMTSDDMATSELKKSTAEMKARSDKQAIMIADSGPRVRRTHKGEELVEGDSGTVSNDGSPMISRKRSVIDTNADPGTESGGNTPGNEVELPAQLEGTRSKDSRSNVSKKPLNIDTKPQEPARKASENFDLDKVFSSVQSPTGPDLRRASTNLPAPSNKGAGDDPDIDRLLQDDDASDSPPYSPAEHPTDPDVVWKGTVLMDSVSKFSAVAKHVAGADLSRSMSWTDLLPKELKIAGRINPENANEYLCSLRYSPQTDVVVVEITPHGESTFDDAIKLFDYFIAKGRYGVLTNKGLGNVRDTYLIPVQPSPARLPDFVINLESHKLSENRTSPSLLVALVIRNDYQGPQSHGLDGASDLRSPHVPPHSRQLSVTNGPPPQMSPVNHQGGFPPTPSPAPPAPAPQIQPDELAAQIEAARILGERVHDPTVGFLLPQAHLMRTMEFEIIRDILEHDLRARQDLQHLSQVLEARGSQLNQNGGSAP